MTIAIYQSRAKLEGCLELTVNLQMTVNFSSQFTQSLLQEMDLSPLNIFPLPAGTMLSFFSRGYGRDTAGGDGFAPHSKTWSTPGSCTAQQPATTIGQQLPQSSLSQVSPVRFLPINSFPQHPQVLISSKFQMADVWHVPPAWHTATSLPSRELGLCPPQQSLELVWAMGTCCCAPCLRATGSGCSFASLYVTPGHQSFVPISCYSY